MSETVGIIDYGAGNLLSVKNALDSFGVKNIVLQSPDGLLGIDRLIVPGVGAFGDCMRNIRERGFADPIRSWIESDKPFLGICIGYQTLFEGSEESPGVPGLGIFRGQVQRFPDGSGDKIPHMGWNEFSLEQAGRDHEVFAGLPAHPHAYFVHSFYPCPEDQSLIATSTSYAGVDFASGIARGNLAATQFHPEKSQSVGLRLLRNFAGAGESAPSSA